MDTRYTVITYCIAFSIALFGMDDDHSMKEQFNLLFLSMLEKRISLPPDLLNTVAVQYETLHKQLLGSSPVTLISSSITSGSSRKQMIPSFDIKTLDNLIKVQKSEEISVFKKTLTSIGKQLLNQCFNPLILLLHDANQKVKPKGDDFESSSENRPKLIKVRDFMFITAAVTVISALVTRLKDKAHEWELLHEEKTDEELLQDFEAVMQPDTKCSARMKELCIRRATERLIDWNKEIYLMLFEHMFFYADDIVVKRYIEKYNIYSCLMDKAMVTFDWKVIRRLLEPDLYNAVKTIFGVTQCGKDFYYDSQYHANSPCRRCPHFSSLSIPIFALLHHADHPKHPDIAYLLHILKPAEHRHFLGELMECSHWHSEGLKNGELTYTIQFPRRNHVTVIKYIRHIIPWVTDKQILNACLGRSETGFFWIESLLEYQRVQKILLSFGADPNVAAYSYTNSMGTHIHALLSSHASSIVNTRINVLQLFILYGAELQDKFFNYIKKKGKQNFLEKRLRSSDTLKHLEKISATLDVVEKIINEENDFRSQFFDHDDIKQKNYPELFVQLNARCPESAGWWILRVLKLRLGLYDFKTYKRKPAKIDPSLHSAMIDPMLHDVNHISQFCLEQMITILSPGWRPTEEAQQEITKGIISIDQETKRALLQWKKLFCFLRKKLPDAFTQKKQLGALMLKIIEQGYYQKPKTYKFLKPIFDRCLDLQQLPDITVQNGIEGSILHVLVRFDHETLKKVIDAYTLRDPFMLLIVLSSNIKNGNFKEDTSTPHDIIEQQLKDYEYEFPGSVQIPEKSRWNEMKETMSGVLPKRVVIAKRIREILPDPIAMKQRAIAHSPFI